MSWGTRNVRTWEFHQQYDRLSEPIKRAAEAAFAAFTRDPAHPVLQIKQLVDTNRGRHRAGTWCVRVTQKYRALFVVVDDANVWYWIGSHNDYENFIGQK